MKDQYSVSMAFALVWHSFSPASSAATAVHVVVRAMFAALQPSQVLATAERVIPRARRSAKPTFLTRWQCDPLSPG